MTAWKLIADEPVPNDRPVLLRSPHVPFGFRLGDGTVHLGHRGNGNTPGLWVASQFYADDPVDYTIGSDVFTQWAEIPA